MSAAQAVMVPRLSRLERRRGNTLEPTATDLAHAKLRVYVCAENRLLREALSRVLLQAGAIQVLGDKSPFDVNDVFASQAEVLLLSACGSVAEDLDVIRQIRSSAPSIRVLLIGIAPNGGEFLQCVRAGISGYLLRDASSAEVLEAVRAVHAGEAVCPRSLCAMLFRFVANGLSELPLGAASRSQLSRRELQLLPLLAEGLTNLEMARRLGRSEQTIKNHLNRMRHKLGVKDRLELAHVYYAQTFVSGHSGAGREEQ